MSSLVFVTQLIDDDDPALGFVPGLIRGLTSSFDRVWVVANEVRGVSVDLDAEVVSLGKEHGAGRVSRSWAYLQTLSKISRERPGAIVAHMCPSYLNLAAPIAKPARIPLVLWFAHPSVTPTLRVAERLSHAVLTSLPGAFPLPSRKVRIIGQATNVRDFPYTPRQGRRDALQLLALGRTSPSKGLETIVRAVREVRTDLDVTLRIVGPSLTLEEHMHRRSLGQLVEKLEMSHFVRIDSAIPRSGVVDALLHCDAVVNATRSGSGDKTVFEAMAVGRPVLASNLVFSDLLTDLPLDLTFAEGDQHQLAGRIHALDASTMEVRAAVSRELRRRVEQGHSIDHWCEEIRKTVHSLRAYRPAEAR